MFIIFEAFVLSVILKSKYRRGWANTAEIQKDSLGIVYLFLNREYANISTTSQFNTDKDSRLYNLMNITENMRKM